jgi:primary-amine oxidase
VSSSIKYAVRSNLNVSYDNAIKLVEVLQPNKTDALAYLNGTSGPPERWARVAINYGDTDEAQIINYMVNYP